MWITLYLITAVIVALTTWHMSHHLQSLDGPTETARGCCAIIAGAIWPVIAVGGLQILAIHLVQQRLRRAPAVHPARVPVLAPDVAARY